MKAIFTVPDEARKHFIGNLTDEFYNLVINLPEYQEYCKYYDFDPFEEKTIKGFLIWKKFGVKVEGVENSRHALNEFFANPEISGLS